MLSDLFEIASCQTVVPSESLIFKEIPHPSLIQHGTLDSLQEVVTESGGKDEHVGNRTHWIQ